MSRLPKRKTQHEDKWPHIKSRSSKQVLYLKSIRARCNERVTRFSQPRASERKKNKKQRGRAVFPAQDKSAAAKAGSATRARAAQIFHFPASSVSLSSEPLCTAHAPHRAGPQWKPAAERPGQRNGVDVVRDRCGAPGPKVRFSSVVTRSPASWFRARDRRVGSFAPRRRRLLAPAFVAPCALVVGPLERRRVSH